ncbi:MAG TPA: MBL fold metallo-hydrolase [Solirubrobacteraceae bacterium]|jgi:glyoxylase-like metal-dependent hydrolase (beta-lactamase superfamily II)/predicted ester cyclase
MAEEDSASEAAAKVQEVAANVRQASKRRKRAAGSEAEAVARRYFEAIDAHDIDGAVAMWAAGGRENVRGQVDVLAPEGVREFIGELVGAMPDLNMQVVSTTAEGERCGVQWRITGTFAGAGGSKYFGGVAPTGSPIELEGFDLLTVRDGLVQGNDAFTDSMTFARQIGMMPPQGSAAEQRLTGAFNVKTRLIQSLGAGEAELIATGVWVVQGQPGRCNVYLIENGEQAGGGVTLYDAGARTMTRAVAAAGAKLGGITRVVLGHGHTDHRGVAPALGVPVLCHPDEVQDAEGSGGWRYWPADLAGVPQGAKQIQKLLHRYAWDGGPVQIADTVSEGDEVSGFRVIDLPGHAPGLIGLWRESDRLALVSDLIYTIDMFGRDCPPSLPTATYNYDTEQARASIRKLAELEPAVVWAGHGKPVTGDVRGQLLRAAGAI